MRWILPPFSAGRMMSALTPKAGIHVFVAIVGSAVPDKQDIRQRPHYSKPSNRGVRKFAEAAIC